MFKKTVTYTDYNGVERTEDFYFNLTKAELLEMELGTDGGFSSKLERILNSKDVKEIIGVYKELLEKSYGVKSADGSRFVKSDELVRDFVASPAYSDLFMLFATDEDAAAEFIKEVVPSDMKQEVSKIQLLESQKAAEKKA